MLNLNCIICAELFAQSDDVHVTTCGHMFHYPCLTQWLQRSKTCPQCRNRCNERNIFRLYFNLANLDASHIDVASLQEQLDNAKLQLQIKENEIKKSEELVKSLKDSQKKCMKTITGLEEKLKKNDFVLLSYMEQIKMLKADAKVTEDLRKEVKALKRQLETVEGVSCLLAASNAEAEKLLKTESDAKKLCVWVTTLKRELRNCDSKKTDLRNILRVTQSDLRREIDYKKKLEERISELESECYQLNEELKTLKQQSMPSTSKQARNASARNSLSSVNNSFLDILKKDEKRLTISPTIKETVRKIEESDSPYLNIKSSSVGLMPYAFKRNQDVGLNSKDTINTAHTTTKLAMLKVSPNKSTNTEAGHTRKISSDLTERYSIFKKPRLVLSTTHTSASTALTSASTKPVPSNFVFNGFGGSEKIDPFAHNSSDDEVEITEDTAKKTKPLGSLQSNVNNSKSNGFAQLRKTNSATGSSLSDRLKSGGLRNFMRSNHVSKLPENSNSDIQLVRNSFPTLRKAHSTTTASDLSTETKGRKD